MLRLRMLARALTPGDPRVLSSSSVPAATTPVKSACRTPAGRRAAGCGGMLDPGPGELRRGAVSGQPGRRGADEGAKYLVSTVGFRQEYSGREPCNSPGQEPGVDCGAAEAADLGLSSIL